MALMWLAGRHLRWMRIWGVYDLESRKRVGGIVSVEGGGRGEAVGALYRGGVG